MASPLPFAISSLALTHLLVLLEKAKTVGAGIEPGLSLCFAYEQLNAKGEVTERLREKHFCLGGASPAHWSKAHRSVRATIGGHDLWIPRETLEALRGKTLTLVKRNVALGRQSEIVREFLIAK